MSPLKIGDLDASRSIRAPNKLITVDMVPKFTQKRDIKMQRAISLL